MNMLNELITWILNTYLGKYLENFNPAQLSVALISGEVELENVPIRKDALRSFGVPLQTLSGSIGRIKLQIPVRQFRTSPWSIVIERVYGVFGPKDISDWESEKEKDAEYEYKLRVLDGLETNWKIDNGFYTENFYSLSYSSWINYGTSLATNILENLELRINDVHLRYEDTTSSSVSIAAGIRLKSISAQSCDSSWTPCAKNLNINDISFKILDLTELNIYWDKLDTNNTCSHLKSKDLLNTMGNICVFESHQFITSPINATVKFKRERCKQALRSKNRPRISCEVALPDINIFLSDIQYGEIVSCMSGLQRISDICEFRICRPTSSISNGSKIWWQYAAKCYGFTYRNSADKWIIARENMRYISICRRLVINPTESIGKEEKQFKFDIEKNRSLTDLKTLRSSCYESISANEIHIQYRSTVQGKGILYHWFPNWLGWHRDRDNMINAQSQSKDEETYKNIEDDIMTALKETIENDSFSKRDAVFGNITFALSNGRIYLLSNQFGKKIALLDLEMESLFCFIEVKPKLTSFRVGVSVGSISLNDHFTESTEYPFLIKPQNKENPKSSSIYNEFLNFFTKKISENLDQQPWFQLEFEKNPSEHQSDFNLVIKSKSIDVVYNECALNWLVSFFSLPFYNRQKLQYGTKKNKGKSYPLSFFKNLGNVIVGQKENRKKWSFEIDISAPRIICVENFQDKNGSVVVIDFGRFQLLKNERPLNFENILDADSREKDSCDDLFMTPCSTPPGSQTSFADSTVAVGGNVELSFHDTNLSRIVINNDTGLDTELHDGIYDKYIINLAELQVLVCKNGEYGYACLKHSSSFHLLDKFNISLHLERKVVNTFDLEYPTINLYGSLNKIVAHVNEQKLFECLRIVNPIKLGFLKNPKSLDTCDAEIKNIYEEFELSSTFFQFVIGQIILEIQSVSKSIAEIQVIGAKASITKKSDELHIIMSVHGFLLVDAIQSFGPDFELLIASHRHVEMDSVSGSLKQSEPCSPKSEGSPDPDAHHSCTSPHDIYRAVNDMNTG